MHIDRPHQSPLPGEKAIAPIPRFWVLRFCFSQHYKHGPMSSTVGVNSHDAGPLKLSLSCELVFFYLQQERDACDKNSFKIFALGQVA